MGLGIGLINALAVHETGEKRFIGPLVEWVLESLGPWDGQSLMAWVVVPSAEPYNVLGCCWNIAQRASLDLVALPVVYGCLLGSRS